MKRKIPAFLTAAMCFASAVPFNAIAENSVKGLEGLQEAGGSGSLISGEQSDGVYEGYYSKLSDISETAEADTAKLIIDKDYASDTVNSSCTVKSLGKDLTIDAGDKNIIVLLDEAVLEKTITVKADKGSVTFFIQGSLTCGKDSKGIVWHEICDGCKITDDKYIPVTFYGSEDSAVTLNDEAILCGSLRLPYTVLDDRSTGAFKIEYVSESDNKHYMMKPTVIGDVLVKKLVNSDVVFAYCAKKADSGEIHGLTISHGTKQMTIDDVKELAKKGDALDWSDFEEYKGEDVGSGLYIWQFELEKGFFLRVGGVPDRKPDYIDLSRKYGEGIDIRTEDIDAYLKAREANYLTVTVQDTYELDVLVRIDKSYLYKDYMLMSKSCFGSDIVPVPGMKLSVNYSGILEIYPGRFENVYDVKVVSEDAGLIKGDSNCDGQVDMADVVFIMQALANPDRYGEKAEEYQGITALGKLNGDMNGDGLTVGDALAIQKKLLGITENEAPVIKLSTVIPQKGTEYVEMKPYESMASSYDPVLSSLDGIGVWFDFRSEKYPITLTADKGTFKTYTYKSGGIGTVNEVGSTYEVGKSGSVSWVPDDISIPIGYEAKIKITGDDNGKSVDLGTLIINKNPNSSESAVFVTLQKPDTSASSQPFPNLSDIVTIDNDYLKNKGYQGIGISLEFDSKDYPIALTAAEGGFVVENTDSSTGLYKILGKTCEIGKSGMVIWEPLGKYMSYDYEFNFSPERLDIEVLVEAIDGDRRVELGKIYIAQVERNKFTASLDAKAVSPYRAVIADKTYVYEKEGVGSDFTITFNADGTYGYYEGVLSSYKGAGTWKVTDDVIIMTEGVSKKVNYLKIQGSDLVYIEKDSDNFYYIKVKDGEKFSVQSAS